MKTFDVYKHPTQGFQAVKRGFGWPAFFFTFIWAFVKKMWGLGFAFLGIEFVGWWGLELIESRGTTGTETIETVFGAWIMLLLALLAYKITVGFKGNDWRRGNLVKRGFEHVKRVEANSPEKAFEKALSITTESTWILRTCSNCNTGFNWYPEVCPDCGLPTTCQHGRATKECPLCGYYTAKS